MRQLTRRDKDGNKIIETQQTPEQVRPTLVQTRLTYNITDINQALKIITSARKTLHIDQANISNELGISQPAYSALELGNSAISLKQFVTICNHLNIQLSITA